MVKVDGIQGSSYIPPAKKYTLSDAKAIIADGIKEAKWTIEKGYPEALKSINS